MRLIRIAGIGAQEPLRLRRTRRCLVPYVRIGHEVRLTIGQPSYGIPRACQTKTQLWVGEADQARPPQIPCEFEHARVNFLIMEVSVLRDQLARMPTRGYIARAALGIIFSTSVVSTSAGGSSRADGAADSQPLLPLACRWP